MFNLNNCGGNRMGKNTQNMQKLQEGMLSHRHAARNKCPERLEIISIQEKKRSNIRFKFILFTEAEFQIRFAPL